MLRNWMLYPHDPGFSAAEWLAEQGSPRVHEHPWLGDWIDEAAAEEDLNARWLIVLAEKEQSAITATDLSGHAWRWLMGYGYTEGQIHDQYAGARTQVFSAARGLRGYLEPGGYHAVPLVAHPFDVLDGGTYTPQTIAEAAALLYTPRLSALRLHERIWEQWFDADAGAPEPRQADVAEIAEQVLARVQHGEHEFSINGIPFEAYDQARCSEFVRECHAAVTGVQWPGWVGRYAVWTERGLRQAGHELSEPQRGCVVAANADVYGRYGREAVWGATESWIEARQAYGHVAIYLGDGRCAENSTTFRVRTLQEIGEERLSGYYAPLAVDDTPARRELLVLLDPATDWGRTFEMLRHEDGRTFVPARALLEALGYEVHAEHLQERQRIYARPTERIVEIAERIARGADG